MDRKTYIATERRLMNNLLLTCNDSALMMDPELTLNGRVEILKRRKQYAVDLKTLRETWQHLIWG
ncbi:hypothetical protein GD1_84 [Paraglaciecola Antarctic GD virus 1]|nr:hypothetical protein GD1_84 [Paraglaciecola Antarctic GD virus 1]